MLWVVTAVALAFVTFPNYVGYLIAGENKNVGIISTINTERMVFDLKGMTCEGCAAHIQNVLSEKNGVLKASVSYDNKTAEIVIKKGKVSDLELIEIIEKAGYKAVPNKQNIGGKNDNT